MEKLTKVEKFGMVVGALSGVEGSEGLVEFIQAEIDRLVTASEKKKATRKPTKAQLENATMVADIGDFFVDADQGVAYTADEVAFGCGFNEFSSQKMTALLKQAVESGYCVKVAKADSNAKKVGYVSAIEPTEVAEVVDAETDVE